MTTDTARTPASDVAPDVAAALASVPTPLTAADRCDRCGAQPYVRAIFPTGAELLFCGHHANAHGPSLLGAGADLHDETDKLLTAREPGFGV